MELSIPFISFDDLYVAFFCHSLLYFFAKNWICEMFSTVLGGSQITLGLPSPSIRVFIFVDIGL